MRTITLFLLAVLATTAVDAAWYQKTDLTIVDPIQSVLGGNLAYTGNNLEPSANLSSADLYQADLYQADLRYATLTGADLSDANLTNAYLYHATLTSADLSGADLDNASLMGANLTEAQLWGANLLNASLYQADLTAVDLSGSILSATDFWNTATWTDAFYYTDDEPTWAIGMDQAWRDSVGILALAAVPEPATLLLALLGLALLPRRRRR